MKTFGYGLIGSGFMGKCHAYAMRNAPRNFALPLEPRFEIMADIDAPSAARAAGSLGFARSTGDWRSLATDPAVDVVSITTPNSLHKPMALAALAAGKTVWCEKPLAATPADAKEMADAATSAGVQTIVGFSYLRNPLVGLAHEIVASGEIGEPVSFRGVHLEDYMSDPAKPWSFRIDPAADHPHYSAFVPVAGHHIGFNELKTIEAKILVDALAGGKPAAWPDFTDAWRVAQTVEAIVRSSRERRWIKTAEM
jgi:predicted dehydrogenase